MRDCPVCGSSQVQPSVRRERVPIFQNVVYPDAGAAQAAPQAPLLIGTCGVCGFSYNMVFDESLLVYDENYDNHVASDLFTQYYRDLAAMMIERFDLTTGTVYDVGCGKGEFLRILCEMAPGIRGVGIDPSCSPTVEGNFELINAYFERSLFQGGAKLVIMRHVLEHIGEPVAFLRSLREAMPSAPLFVEVPDLKFILESGAFWDFCYEHCNYFDLSSLRHALTQASFRVVDQQRCFKDQYQWAISVPGDNVPLSAVDAEAAVQSVASYADTESQQLAAMTERARESRGVVIWGMATKGTLLSNILEESLVLGGIDANSAKQGKFAAGSGLAIHPPGWLKTLEEAPTVIAMNPNYRGEIEAAAKSIRPDVTVEAV